MEQRSQPHSPSCAKRIRESGNKAGHSVAEIVLEIHRCCHVSVLRAHRLARGWTQTEAVGHLRDLAESLGLTAPRTDADQLRLWELGDHQPRRKAIDLLCRLYDCTAHGIGLAAPSTLPGTHLPQATASSASGLPAPDPLTDRIDAARRSVDRTLALSSVSAAQMDLLDERLLDVRRQYLYTAPTDMLNVLLHEMEEVKGLSADRQPAAVQVRLSEMTAVLATLIADALMKLGRLTPSRAWYDTAQTAADDSGNLELRARVRAQRAMLPYYYGPLEGAVVLGREARLLSRGRQTPTAAFAAAAEARALARQGNAAAAEAAIAAAQHMYEHCHHGDQDDAFAFPERRLHLYLSGAYTALGRSSQARRAQEQALALYPARTGIDPALLQLEAAICLAQDRSPAEACQLAGTTFLQVPASHRTHILEERARHVLGVLPPGIRSGRAARDLTEILALPKGRT
ncbi:helix-turn-helix transcriptional regulator [Streptomyces sp. MNP-20]|uniref:helix-turn-helix domain-containing protein n=1 Tax=Streptomyces sp. MNP-20 TaxID=2721165 RepID=UPI0020A62A87|nr:helix-turn-helix transcriptional regulator [Streptomyces sp. MNP-20]